MMDSKAHKYHPKMMLSAFPLTHTVPCEMCFPNVATKKIYMHMRLK